jgi:creatinine amidohydrolase
MPFPGTISLQPATFQALMYDVMMSLYKHGFRRFALPLGHGGNLASMHVVAQKFVDDTQGTQALVLNWLQMITRYYKEILTSKKNEGHSGEPETSRLLACHPELVEMKRARVYYSEAADKAESADHPLMGGGIFKPDRNWKEAAPYGSVGDPTLAKAETGEKIWDIIIGWMAEAVKRDLT